MARYFLSSLQIEGFRGINNQGDPLNFKFRSDCVNSFFAANGLGKSSAFESLAFAIKGVVPKLKRLPAWEHPDDCYANQFHGTRISTVSLSLKPDDGSPEVTVTITRDNTTGKRLVTSPSFSISSNTETRSSARPLLARKQFDQGLCCRRRSWPIGGRGRFRLWMRLA